MQSLKEEDPVDEVKFSGQEIIRSSFPPGQYEPAVQMGQGLVPALDPLPKYPGMQRHLFCENEDTGPAVLLGQLFFDPAMHHESSGQVEHTSPSVK